MNRSGLSNLIFRDYLLQHCRVIFPVFLGLLFIAFSCTVKKSTQAGEDDLEAESDTAIEAMEDNTLPDKGDWFYEELYGTYEHESSGQGFTALVVIRPEGNDLWLDIRVTRSSCSGLASGPVGLAAATENEYAGFFSLDDCRMELYFNTVNKTIRVEEIGICQLYEPGCRFAGIYKRRDTDVQ